VVDDIARRRAIAEAAGATLTYEGHLADLRYDTPERTLLARDHVLRMRVYAQEGRPQRVELDWKGATQREGGYKVREELGALVDDPEALAAILDRLGYVVTVAIDREIAQYDLVGAMVRFERYPRMDDLVEVEGTPDQIERAIALLQLPRSGFTSDRLPDFVRRFQERTRQVAVLSDAELRGDVHYDATNA
jgi:adenylate cyclase class IV